MPDALTFRYRPAPLRPPRELRLDGPRLWIGEDGPFDLSRVKDAVFVTHAFGDSRMERLDLTWPDTHRAIGCNAGRKGFSDSAEGREHRAAVGAVLRALAAARPDAQVTLGAARGTRWALFCIGIVSLLAGVGIGAGALASGVSGGRLAGVAMPVVLLTVLGVALVAGNWPSGPRRQIAAEELADMIAPR